MASSSFPSSSSSSVPPRGPWAYDVFLSFRGEDTRYNFVDHLYAALDRNGLIVFKDDKMLRVGKEISSELMKAIEESTCTVVVLSKNYANSSWCLAELTKVMECHNQKNGRLVIPVFYHVEPTDVRKQKGSFETAFQQHKEKFKEEMDEVKKWREVLTSAANLSGYHISEEQAEASYVTKIVRHIQRSIKTHGLEKMEIGLVSRINKLKSLLDLKATEEVCVIGIWGMGGIGKTTVAQALFNEIYHDFDGSSFVNDVRENSSDKKKIRKLQKKIVKQIAHNDKPKIKDVGAGTEMIIKMFREKKILLVLDDVDDVQQLEVLGAIPKWFGKGSRIIITTRDDKFLANANGVYRPDLLPMEYAVELFSWHAFRRNGPPEGYEDLSNRAIRYTCGLPLALRVLGCFFYGKDTNEWEIDLNRLDQAKKDGSLETPFTHEKNGIMETFKISFDGLYEYEKNIFLDIASFFKGSHQKYVTEVLECSGLDSVETGIKALIKKSLITVSDKRINMHDVLQEMGLEIIRKSYPNSRLCRTEEIFCLKKNKNLETVTGIMHSNKMWWQDENVRFSGDVFESMNNLRLLETWGYFTSCKPTTFPDKLGWLCWDQYPFSSLPVANMRKLVSLQMDSGKIKHLWRGNEYMPNLKSIRLSEMSIRSLPDVSGAVNLEKLEVSFCDNLVDIHKSLGTRKKLAYLSFENCKNLRYLPSLEEMPALDTINLSGCSALERFPEVSSNMVELSNIYLDGCSNLKNIPNSICELEKLKILHLQDCKSLQDLPEELGSMGKLEELLLGNEYICQRGWQELLLGSEIISNLLYSINLHALTKLCRLRKLDLSGRHMEEQDFPISFHEFSSLKELNLSHNHKLVQLPGSISRLSSLKHLELNFCDQLESIQGLPSGIQVLKAIDCTSLKKIEDLSNEYKLLHMIHLSGCETLLKYDENKAYLEKMLQQSFVYKCIAVHGQLSIWIPKSKIPSWFKELGSKIPGSKIPSWFKELGSKIPSWFKDLGSKIPSSFKDLRRQITFLFNEGEEQRHEIALNLPPKRHTSIMGFVISVEFEDDDEDGIRDDVSMVYIPESVFWEQMHDGFGKGDWSFLVESGRSVSIIVKDWCQKFKRCAAHIVDVESIQQIKNRIPDYCDPEDVKSFHTGDGFYEYGIEFKVRSIR